MGIVPATTRNRGASGAGARYPYPSIGLCSHEGIADLPGGRGIDARLAESQQIETQYRQRSVLARLVRSLNIDDAEQVAQQLLIRFGSLGQLLTASPSSLSRCVNNSAIARMLPAAWAVALEAMREDVQRQEFCPRNPRILRFLTSKLQSEAEEHLHAIFLDRSRRVILEERIASGDWAEIRVRLRPLMQRALELNAAGIVLFHNHPSGELSPSEEDIKFTAAAARIAEALGISIYDHLIVAGPSVFSMRSAGLI